MATSTGCGTTVGPSETWNLVNQGISNWGNLAESWAAEIDTQLNLLSGVELDAVPEVPTIDEEITNISPPDADPPSGSSPVSDYVKPNSPGVPTLEYSRPSVSQAPDEDIPELSITLPTPPAPLGDYEFDTKPEESTYTFPTAPDDELPTVPTLTELDLPTAPSLPLRTFDGVAPEVDFTAPGELFEFTEELYSSTNLTGIETRIASMLDGDLALPEAVWTAIWDRARVRVDQAAAAKIGELERDASRRGFTLLQGAVDAKIEAAKQEAYNETGQLLRDQSIERAKMQEEAVRYAVAQGIQLEGTLIAAHLQVQERRYQAARFMQEASISIFNANVAMFNARTQLYSTKANVFRTEIEAERTQLEKYRIELEGQRIISQINQQEIEIYSERLKALMYNIDRYKAEVDAVKVLTEVDRNRIERYRVDVQTFGELVDAKVAETQAYGEQIRGELAKAQMQEVMASVFSTRVEAWARETGATVDLSRLDIEAERLKLTKFTSTVEKYRADIQAELARIQTQNDGYRTEADIYSTVIQGETSRVGSEVAVLNATLEQNKLIADHNLRVAQFSFDKMLKSAELDAQELNTLATVKASLAAAAMAAVNYNASIGSEGSESKSCSTVYRYSGDIT